MNLVTKCLAPLAATVLFAAPAAADPQTYSWTAHIPQGKKGAVVVLPPLTCPTGSVFLVTGIQGTPDASAFVGAFPYATGSLMLGGWAIQAGIGQMVGTVSKPTMLTAFGVGMTAAAANLLAGQPFRGTMLIALAAPANQNLTFNVHLTGQCGASPVPLTNPPVVTHE